MGASAALMYAHHQPSEIDFLILDSPFKDLKKLIQELVVNKTGIPKLLL